MTLEEAQARIKELEMHLRKTYATILGLGDWLELAIEDRKESADLTEKINAVYRKAWLDNYRKEHL